MLIVTGTCLETQFIDGWNENGAKLIVYQVDTIKQKMCIDFVMLKCKHNLSSVHKLTSKLTAWTTTYWQLLY